MVKSTDSEIRLPQFEYQFCPASYETLSKSLKVSKSQFPSVATCKEFTIMPGKLYSAFTINVV